MKRRIPESYTVMIVRTDKEPTVFSIQPIAIWLSLASVFALLLASFLLGWSQGQSSSRRNAMQFPAINRAQST